MKLQSGIPVRTEQNTVCFTGHRRLSGTDIPLIRERLQNIIHTCYSQGYRWFICGGALGFDTLAAEEVLNAKREHPEIGLFLAVPCADQSNRWNVPDQQKYRRILDAADEKIILSPHYFSGCMHLRNQFMVRHASVCVCWLHRFAGGTGYTVRYALACHREVINLCLPESMFPVQLKEPSWNCTFISPSVSGNALIVRLIRLPAVIAPKWKHIHLQLSGKRTSGNSSYLNR